MGKLKAKVLTFHLHSWSIALFLSECAHWKALDMINLDVTAITRPLDLDKITAFVDLESRRPGRPNLVTTFNQSGRLSFVLNNGNRTYPPVAYQYGKHFLILSEFYVSVIDTTDIEAGEMLIPIHFQTYAARAVKQGVVILHETGCTMLNADLTDAVWRHDDQRIITSRVDNGELRVYHGEHQSFLIDLNTGFYIPEPEEGRAALQPSKPEDEGEESCQIIRLAERVKR